MLFLQLPNIDVDKIEAADSAAKASIESKFDAWSHMPVEDIIKSITMGFLEVLWKIVLAVAIYYVGRWIIRKIKKFMSGVFERRHVDSSLRIFLTNLVSISLTIILLIVIVDILGLNTTSFIAIFASAGLAIGMALSGTLQNFAGGVMLLLLKPYRIGDYIEAQGFGGTVKSIQLFNTVINTSDNKTVIIPNGALSTGTVNNFSRESTRRVEWIIGIDYGDDFAQAKAVIEDLLEKDERVLKSPSHLVAINELAASSVNIVIRAWTEAGNFWDLYFDMNAKIFKTLPEKGLHFPFAQLDVHINKDE